MGKVRPYVLDLESANKTQVKPSRTKLKKEECRWGSLWCGLKGTPEQKSLLSDWPVPRPRQWTDYVNRPQSEKVPNAIRQSVVRVQPFGSPQ